MECERFDNIEHVGPDGANNSKPGREEVEMSLQERGQSVAVIRSMVFGFAEAVNLKQKIFVIIRRL